MSYNVKFLAVVRVSDLVVAMTAARGDGAGAHHGMLEKVLTSGGLRSVKAGSRHTLEEKSEGVKFHFTIDASNTYVLVVITDFDYPVRLAFDLLNKQLLGKVSSQYAAKVASCQPNGLSRSCAKMLGDLMQQYEDTRNVDKLSAVQAQVDTVKDQMSENIRTVVKNTEALEDMDEKASTLATSAKTFEQQAGVLRRKMWWQNCKMKLLFALIGVVVIAVLGVVIWQATKSDDPAAPAPAPAPAPAATTAGPSRRLLLRGGGGVGGGDGVAW